MNTVVGRTISLWDNLGFTVRFQISTTLRTPNLEEPTYPTGKGYLIVLNLAVGHIVFRVTFCENSKQKEPDQRILLVDDSKAIRGVLSKALKDAGYQVEEAADGRMALDKHQAFQPHLTIMDINMPDMNGLEVITKIRKADREARFVMLTSSSRKDEVLTAKNLNVRKYLIKPVEIGSFLQVVREALQ